MSFANTVAKGGGMAPSTYTISHQMSVAWYRLSALMVVVGIRLGISISLLVVGVFWLLKTTSIQDIILNAAALGFVMDLDELVFVTMPTMAVKTVVRKTEFDASWRLVRSVVRRTRCGVRWVSLVLHGCALLSLSCVSFRS